MTINMFADTVPPSTALGIMFSVNTVRSLINRFFTVLIILCLFVFGFYK